MVLDIIPDMPSPGAPQEWDGITEYYYILCDPVADSRTAL